MSIPHKGIRGSNPRFSATRHLSESPPGSIPGRGFGFSGPPPAPIRTLIRKTSPIGAHPSLFPYRKSARPLYRHSHLCNYVRFSPASSRLPSDATAFRHAKPMQRSLDAHERYGIGRIRHSGACNAPRRFLSAYGRHGGLQGARPSALSSYNWDDGAQTPHGK